MTDQPQPNMSIESKPTTKMKPEAFLFSNSTEDHSAIVSEENIHQFWKELEMWVRAMMVENPDEIHESWYKKWDSYTKFNFSSIQNAFPMIAVCVQEDLYTKFTVLDILVALAQQIPYLDNHMYATSADEDDTTVAVKFKMYQSRDYIHPLITKVFTDTGNQFNAFQTSTTGNKNEQQDDEAEVYEQEKKKRAVDGDNEVHVEDASQHNEEIEDTLGLNDSLISFSHDDSDVVTGTSMSSRQRRKQGSIKTIIVDTCRKEIQSMQNSIMNEMKSTLLQHLQSIGPSQTSTQHNPSSVPTSIQPAPQPPGTENQPSTASINPNSSTISSAVQHTPPVSNKRPSPSSSNPVPSSSLRHNRRGTSRRQPSSNNPQWNTSWRHKNNPNYNPNITIPSTTASVPTTVPTSSTTGFNMNQSTAVPSSSTSGFNTNQFTTAPTSSARGLNNNTTQMGSAPPPTYMNSQSMGQSGNPTPSFTFHHAPTGNFNPQQHHVPPSMAFNNPTPNPPSFQQMPQSLHKGGVIYFGFNGSQYELRDNDFIKYTGDLLKVNTTDNIIHFYKHLQSVAIQRNIFVKEFEKLQYWQRGTEPLPPTTLFTTLLTLDNSELAYKRMRSALYQKISKATFQNPEHKEIVTNHAVTQDGFALLYDLAARCHPHLASQTSRYNRYNIRPQMLPHDNIYTLKRKYETWLEIERVDNHTYSEEKILSYVMQDLHQDNRYDRALRQLEIDLSTHQTMQSQSANHIPFPTDLLLHNLPQTVMSCYSDEEKTTLFSESSISHLSDSTSSSGTSIEHGYVRTLFSAGNHDDIQAFVNVMKTRSNMPARTSVDKFCQGCGKYGHDVYHQGCDFCAQLSIALKFLEKHPDDVKDIIKTYMNFQRQRKKNSQKMKQPNKSPFKKKSVRATVNAIQTALGELVDHDSSESDQNNDEFEDRMGGDFVKMENLHPNLTNFEYSNLIGEK